MKPIKRWSFEYLYMIVMFFYAFQLTPGTLRMRSSLSGDPFPFLLPIVLTAILLYRNKISWFNRGLGNVLGIFLIWVVLITIKYGDFSSTFFSYNFFLIYAIIIAYIHVQVFGKALFSLYEDILVKFAIISLPLWLFQVLLPGAAASVFHMFPEVKASSGGGNHVFLLYNWFDPAYSYISSERSIRNSGPAFEPGIYSVFLCIGIFFNLLRNGITLKNNKNLIILLLALLTTFSTTGYPIAFITILIFYIKTHTFKNNFIAVFFGAILMFFMFQLDFMGDKLSAKSNIEEINKEFYVLEEYYSQRGIEGTRSSLDRFQGMYFEWNNFLKDPILGYSRKITNSWFSQNFLELFSLAGGLVKILSQYGIIWGLILFYMLFRSSKAIARSFSNKSSWLFALIMIMALISYILFDTPIITAFWFYGMWSYIPDRKFAVPEYNRTEPTN